MGKRGGLIAKYAKDLKTKCKINPGMALLTKVTVGCGASIHGDDAATVAGSDANELVTVKKNFLTKKLGLPDSPGLTEATNAAIDTYGRSDRNKYRAEVYYRLTRPFGKKAAYKLPCLNWPIASGRGSPRRPARGRGSCSARLVYVKGFVEKPALLVLSLSVTRRCKSEVWQGQPLAK